MSELADGEKLTEGGWNDMDDKKFLDDSTYNRSNFLMACRKL
jgi:hypothetical protein